MSKSPVRKPAAEKVSGDSPKAGRWGSLRYRRQVDTLKRNAVLMTAAEAFCERGFHGASLDAIAARLKITKPTLYYYFSSKDDLLFEAVRYALVILDEAIDQITKSQSSGREILVEIMIKYLELALNPLGRCVQMGLDPLPEPRRRQVRKLARNISLRIRAVVERGIADGSIAKCDPMMAVSNITGALGWINQWYRDDGPDTPREMALRSISILMDGLAPRVGLSKARGNGANRPALSKKTGRANSPAPMT